MGNTVGIPLWIFYGLIFGGFIPGMIPGLPLWFMFPGIAIGLFVMYFVDKWISKRNMKDDELLDG